MDRNGRVEFLSPAVVNAASLNNFFADMAFNLVKEFVGKHFALLVDEFAHFAFN
jgi:hypothetical protein